MSKAPNDIDRQVGSRVRMRRMMVGLSQERLGDALGVTFQQVQKYEKGTNRISASRLQQMAGILGVSIQYLYDDSGHAEGSGPQPGFGEQPSPRYEAELLTSEGLRLLRAFHGISDRKLRRRVLDLVQAISSKAPE